MILSDFSRDLENVLREVSCTYFCNISAVDCRLTSKEGAEAIFSVCGYGNGVCEVDEIYKYIRQYFSSLGYFIVGQSVQSTFSNSMPFIEGIFSIKVNFQFKRLWVYLSYAY